MLVQNFIEMGSVLFCVMNHWQRTRYHLIFIIVITIWLGWFCHEFVTWFFQLTNNMRLKEVIWYRSESIIGLFSFFKSPYILLIFYYGCIKSHLRRSGHCKTLFALQNRPVWSVCAAPYLALCKPKFIMKQLNRYFTLSTVPKCCGKLLALFQPAVTQCWLQDLNHRWETCQWYECLKTNTNYLVHQ